ncbi:MAG: CAP domain-containing protein, partial [bacterium]
AARDLVADQSRTGGIGHTGSGGATTEIRINRHGKWGARYSENIAYAVFATGREVVVNLIVDDGVRDRGHRRNVFDQGAHVAGIACGPHPKFGAVCVIDQAGSYTSR